jgi:hypothetical protein
MTCSMLLVKTVDHCRPRCPAQNQSHPKQWDQKQAMGSKNVGPPTPRHMPQD